MIDAFLPALFRLPMAIFSISVRKIGDVLILSDLIQVEENDLENNYMAQLLF